MANKSGFPFELGGVETLAAARTLTRADSGKVFLSGAADVVVTLPAVTADLVGVVYKFVTVTLSASTGYSISPNASDRIQGKGITAADDKDIINTAATDAIGDLLEVVCDSTDGWTITGMLGTWARQP